MKFITLFLNLPWTLLAILGVLISGPSKMKIRNWAIVFWVKSFWWYAWLPGMSGIRAMTMGNVVLLGPNILENDLEHELVHIKQFQREPLIHPFLSLFELLRKGNRYSKYEDEAYRIAGNKYIMK